MNIDESLQAFLDENLSCFAKMLSRQTPDGEAYIKSQLAMMLRIAYHNGACYEQSQNSPSLRELAKTLSVDERYLLRSIDRKAPAFVMDGDIPEFLRRQST